MNTQEFISNDSKQGDALTKQMHRRKQPCKVHWKRNILPLILLCLHQEEGNFSSPGARFPQGQPPKGHIPQQWTEPEAKVGETMDRTLISVGHIPATHNQRFLHPVKQAAASQPNVFARQTHSRRPQRIGEGRAPRARGLHFPLGLRS